MSGISSMMVGTYKAAAAGGGVDADTSLLLHFDGANLSTTFTDSSTNAYVFAQGTGGSAATIRTENKKFGTGSLHGSAATGSNVAIYRPGTKPTPLNLSQSTWTIEWFADYTGAGSAVGVYGTGQACFHITVLKGSNKFQIEYSIDGTYGQPNSYKAIDFANSTWNAWRHYAVVRNGNGIEMYAEGNRLSATIADGPGGASDFFFYGSPFSGKSTYNGEDGVAIGDNWVGSDYGLRRSYLDELRVSTVSRYTANFTPTTSAFSS